MIETEAGTAVEQSPICTCCTCGYQWERGTDGSHLCTDRLLARIAALEKPVLFMEMSSRLGQEAFESARRSLKKTLGERYQIVLLSDEIRLVNQQAWKPARLDIECGHISIKSPGRGRGTTVTVDGQEMKNVRRIAFELTPDNVALVNIEFVARPTGDA